IPSEGVRIVRYFTPNTQGWKNYNKMDYFFRICRITRQEFYARQARSSSTKLFVSIRLTSSYPYAREITRILENFEITLRREPTKKMGKTSVFTGGNWSKNMGIFKDVDGIFKPTDAENVYAPPPALEGGQTMEFIYNKLHDMDLCHSSELSDIRDYLNFLKQKNCHQSEDEEEEEEERNEENEEMDESPSCCYRVVIDCGWQIDKELVSYQPFNIFQIKHV
ncbi:hypothetical protein RYX36_035642, partial [Vicia faba]